MIILHTSDWHLGSSLHGRSRYEEHAAFLDWLYNLIIARRVEMLLVSGDIFDSGVPSNRSQAQYYRFLHRIGLSSCSHVVIIGGNHDSPSLLEAPRELLKQFNIHVVARIPDNLDDEIITVTAGDGTPQAVVCAVPYLRDRQVRSAKAGESVREKGENLVAGIVSHYRDICTRAERTRNGSDIPLIVMGHLFVAGAAVGENDGERDLYVGTLAQVPASSFPPGIDYLALGHLHRAQQVGGKGHFRYSGAPLPMNFSEGGSRPSVCLLDTNGRSVRHERLDVPVFRPLLSLQGDLPAILERLADLRRSKTPAWLEIRYTGAELVADLQQQVLDATAETGLEIVRVINTRLLGRALRRISSVETLEHLSPKEVFLRCLHSHDIPEAQHRPLLERFLEAVRELFEEDSRAE